MVLGLAKNGSLVAHDLAAPSASEVEQHGFRRALAGDAVALQLDIEAIAEQRPQGVAARLRQMRLPRFQRHVERIAGAARSPAPRWSG